MVDTIANLDEEDEEINQNLHGEVVEAKGAVEEEKKDSSAGKAFEAYE